MSKRLEGPSLNIRLLQEYIAFSRSLNFSSAAKELYISQSTLSTHMQRLEEALGVSLINHGSKASLTPSGKLFLEYAERIVCVYLEGVNAVKKYASHALDLLVEEPLSSSTLFNATSKVFELFSQQYPEVKLSLRSTRGRTAIESLREGYVEIANILDSHPLNSEAFQKRCEEQNIVGLEVSQEVPLVWMQADNPLARKKSLTVKDIVSTPIVVPADIRFDEWRTIIRSWFAKYNATPILNLQVTETRMEFYMTQLHDRILLLPETEETTRQRLGNQNVICKPLSGKDCTFYTYLAYLNDNDNPLIPLYIDQVFIQLQS